MLEILHGEKKGKRELWRLQLTSQTDCVKYSGVSLGAYERWDGKNPYPPARATKRNNSWGACG